MPTQKVYPAEVTFLYLERKPTGRPCKRPVPSVVSVPVSELIEARRGAFRPISWRIGTMIGRAYHPSPPGRRRQRLRGGPLKAAFTALRVRTADGPVAARAQDLPGEGRE